MIYVKSKYLIRPIVIDWTVGIIIVADVFLSHYIPREFRFTVEIFLMFVYVALFLLVAFHLVFKSFDLKGMEIAIGQLEDQKERRLKYFGIFGREELLSKYKEAYKVFSDKVPFVYFSKSKEELTDMSNLGYYLMILLIFFVGQFSFDYWRPVGPVVFILIVLSCVIFCIRILIWDIVERRNVFSQIIAGHALAIFLLFYSGKSSYIRSFGDEIIGSYFEKSEYKTQYYVNVFPDLDASKNYRLPAEIHVFSEMEEGATTEDQFGREHTDVSTTRYIIIDKVTWPNGGYLDFDDCQVAIGFKVRCIDQEGKEWYIELTDQKVR